LLNKKYGVKKAIQLRFKKVNGWGGERRGAGRPNESGQVNHMKRPKVNFSTPLHLTWRLKPDLVNLRCAEVSALFKAAAARAKDFGLSVVHYSILSNHLHVVVECEDNEALMKGTRSLAATLGKGIRKVAGGRGGVFDGRFHLQVLENPTATRNALAYVLQNYARHSKLIAHVDRYSSAPFFSQWCKLLGKNAGPILEDLRPPPNQDLPPHLSPPRSWLAREGWQKARAPWQGRIAK